LMMVFFGVHATSCLKTGAHWGPDIFSMWWRTSSLSIVLFQLSSSEPVVWEHYQYWTEKSDKEFIRYDS
jgi:hypothetical protein